MTTKKTEKVARCSAHPGDPEHKMFTTAVRVYEYWTVDETGQFEETGDFIEALFPEDLAPSPKWECAKCGASAIVAIVDADE